VAVRVAATATANELAQSRRSDRDAFSHSISRFALSFGSEFANHVSQQHHAEHQLSFVYLNIFALYSSAVSKLFTSITKLAHELGELES
jgi:hypothetical protein